MFEKNMEALKKSNPKLAVELEKINIEDIKSIDVYEAESKDLIIAYNNTLLHSAQNPLEEAKNIWNNTVQSELLSTDFQIVLGLGLGYLFKRAFVNAHSRVYLYEPSLEILRFVFHHVDYSNELNEKRVFFANKLENLLEKFNSEFLTGDKIEVLYLPEYASVFPQELSIAIEKILECCKGKGKEIVTRDIQQECLNSISNIKDLQNVRDITSLKDAFKDKTALYISKATNLDYIKENQDKFITIAKPSLYKELEKANIVPDFVINCKSKKENIDLSKTNFVFDSKSPKETKAKTSWCYLTSQNKIDSWLKEIDDSLSLNNFVNESSVFAINIAKILGCKSLILNDLDLLDKDKSSKNEKNLIIKRLIEKFISKDQSLKIFNTAIDGILISGVEYKKIEDIELLSDSIDKSSISKIYDESKESWESFNEYLNKKLATSKENIIGLEQKLYKGEGLVTELVELFNEKDKDKELESKISEFKEIFNDTKNKCINNPFIFYYLQNEIMDYSKKYNTSVQQNKETIIDNLKLDLEFLAKLVTAISKIKENI